MNETDRLSAPADVFVDSLLHLQAGERVLIYEDERSDPAVAQAIKNSAEQRGATVVLHDLPPGPSVDELADMLMQRLAQGFDVVCELSARNTFYSTPVWGEVHRSAARLYSLSTLDGDAFARCIGAVDHHLVHTLGMKVNRILKAAKRLHIRTGHGTDLRCTLDWGRVESLAKKVRNRLLRMNEFRGWRQEPYVAEPTGLLEGGHSVTFLGGQLGFMGAPETIEGTAMIDGFLWPPDALGRLEAPIRLAIDNGLVSAIDGGDAAVLDKWLDGKSRQIFHFLIGLHPRATLMGRILEAERSYGCVSIGFGVYPFHTDGVMTQPTIVLDDDVVFIEQGRFVHPELAEIDRQLVAPQD